MDWFSQKSGQDRYESVSLNHVRIAQVKPKFDRADNNNTAPRINNQPIIPNATLPTPDAYARQQRQMSSPRGVRSRVGRLVSMSLGKVRVGDIRSRFSRRVPDTHNGFGGVISETHEFNNPMLGGATNGLSLPTPENFERKRKEGDQRFKVTGARAMFFAGAKMLVGGGNHGAAVLRFRSQNNNAVAVESDNPMFRNPNIDENETILEESEPKFQSLDWHDHKSVTEEENEEETSAPRVPTYQQLSSEQLEELRVARKSTAASRRISYFETIDEEDGLVHDSECESESDDNFSIQDAGAFVASTRELCVSDDESDDAANASYASSFLGGVEIDDLVSDLSDDGFISEFDQEGGLSDSYSDEDERERLSGAGCGDEFEFALNEMDPFKSNTTNMNGQDSMYPLGLESTKGNWDVAEDLGDEASFTSGPMFESNNVSEINDDASFTSESNNASEFNDDASFTSGPMFESNNVSELNDDASFTSGPMFESNHASELKDSGDAESASAVSWAVSESEEDASVTSCESWALSESQCEDVNLNLENSISSTSENFGALTITPSTEFVNQKEWNTDDGSVSVLDLESQFSDRDSVRDSMASFASASDTYQDIAQYMTGYSVECEETPKPRPPTLPPRKQKSQQQQNVREMI